MSTALIKDILDIISDRDAMLVRPAEKWEVERCRDDCFTFQLPCLPDGYADFLRITDGCAWQGYEFYGTYECRRKDADFVLYDIITENTRLRSPSLPDEWLVLGQVDEDYFVWDAGEKAYLVADRLTRMETERYDSFAALFAGTIGEDAGYSGGEASQPEEQPLFPHVAEGAPYDDVHSFREGMAAVCLRGKWGFVDDRGRLAVPAIYEKAQAFESGRAFVLLDGKARLIDKKGKTLLKTEYQWLLPSADGAIRAQDADTGLYGCLAEDGSLLVPCRYDMIFEFIDGIAMVTKDYFSYGFIRIDGTEVVPPIYDEACDYEKLPGEEHSYAEVRAGGKWGLIDETGGVVVPIAYRRLAYQHGTVIFEQEDGMFGAMEPSGKILLPAIYDRLHLRDDGLLGACLDGKWGIVSPAGRQVIPPVYDWLGYHWGSIAPVGAGNDGKCGCIDGDLNVVVPFVYDTIYEFEEGRAVAERDGKSGVIDTKGNVVAPIRYHNIVELLGDVTVAAIDKNTIVILHDAQPVSPPFAYEDYRSRRGDSAAWFKANGLWHILSLRERPSGTAGYKHCEALFDSYAAEKAQGAVWEDALLQKLDALLTGDSGRLLLMGDAGAGKTTALALVKQVTDGEDFADVAFIPYFTGLAPDGDDGEYMLDYLIYRLEKLIHRHPAGTLRYLHDGWPCEVDTRSLNFETRLLYFVNLCAECVQIQRQTVMLGIDDADLLREEKLRLFCDYLRDYEGGRLKLILCAGNSKFAGGDALIHPLAPDKGRAALPADQAVRERLIVTGYLDFLAGPPPSSEKAGEALAAMERGDLKMGRFLELDGGKEAAKAYEAAAKLFEEAFEQTRDVRWFFLRAQALAKSSIALINRDRQAARARSDEVMRLLGESVTVCPCPEMMVAVALHFYGLGVDATQKGFVDVWAKDFFREAAGRAAQLEAAPLESGRLTTRERELIYLFYSKAGQWDEALAARAEQALAALNGDTPESGDPEEDAQEEDVQELEPDGWD